MDRKSIKDVYVYGHYLSNGECQYVGKGRKNRAWSFFRRPKKWKFFFEEKAPIVKFFGHGLLEKDACALEIKMIAEHRKKGEALANCTKGGEPGGGFVLKGRTLSPKHREAISRGKKGRANGLAGRVMPKEHRQAISKATQGRRPLTAKEQAKRLATWKKNGMTTKKAKEVECIETGIRYRCAKEASEDIMGSDKHIQACCTGRRKTHMGKTWRYTDASFTQQ